MATDGSNHTWLAAFPRSGVTYLRLCLTRMTGLPTYCVFPEEGEPNPLPWRPQLTAGAKNVFVKTHYLPHHRPDNAPAIYLVRDGRDCIVSLAHFLAWNYGGDVVEYMARLIRGEYKYPVPGGEFVRSWSDHVNMWLTRPAPTCLMRYEDLVEDPRETISTAFAKMGIEVEVHDRKVPTFDELQANNPRFYRRGVVGAWRDEMPENLQAEFEQMHGIKTEQGAYA